MILDILVLRTKGFKGRIMVKQHDSIDQTSLDGFDTQIMHFKIVLYAKRNEI